MTKRILTLIFLLSACTNADTKTDKEIHSFFSPQISVFDDCLPNFDVSPPIEDELLIKTINLSKGKKVVFTLCEPGWYQNRYIAFLVADNVLENAQILTFSLPSSDADAFQVPQQIITEPTFEDDQFVIFHKFTGSATCGYEATFDYKSIAIGKPITPSGLKAEMNCESQKSPGEWPVIMK
jgi:hypothetical protein